MADDQHKPVVDSHAALWAASAVVEVRRGYLELIDRLLKPYPVAFEFDQKKRNQMITLLSRGDTLWVLLLIYSESEHAPAVFSKPAARQRQAILGDHLTRASLARGIAIYEANALSAKPERRHTVAAGRLVEAALAYGLIEFDQQPDEKQQPMKGTKRLGQFIHALGDHAHWTMREAITNSGESSRGLLSSFSESQSNFVRDDLRRLSRKARVTSDDAALSLLGAPGQKEKD